MRIKASKDITTQLANVLHIRQESVLILESSEEKALAFHRGEVLRSHPHELVVLVLVLLLQLFRLVLHLV